jgi:hypothetical protein
MWREEELVRLGRVSLLSFYVFPPLLISSSVLLSYLFGPIMRVTDLCVSHSPFLDCGRTRHSDASIAEGA